MQNDKNIPLTTKDSKEIHKAPLLGRKNVEGRRDSWLIKQLDYYEVNYTQSDIEEIQKRVLLIQENIIPIQRLLLEYPERWPRIYSTLELFREKAKIDWEKRNDEMDYHGISDKEREYLKKSLMLTNLKLSKLNVPLPSPIFNAMYRFIEDKDFEYLLDKK
ncbi:MAG: hypothetical protein GKC01_01055, partial [Candidatus Methanofastidiosa archaeon]|nr:hypothetical protein [Candidatus Methanofastidiosa archaeon]